MTRCGNVEEFCVKSWRSKDLNGDKVTVSRYKINWHDGLIDHEIRVYREASGTNLHGLNKECIKRYADEGECISALASMERSELEKLVM